MALYVLKKRQVFFFDTYDLHKKVPQKEAAVQIKKKKHLGGKSQPQSCD